MLYKGNVTQNVTETSSISNYWLIIDLRTAKWEGLFKLLQKRSTKSGFEILFSKIVGAFLLFEFLIKNKFLYLLNY